MMQAKAQLKNFRSAPRKVRIVADLIRGLTTKEALNQLLFSKKKIAPNIIKLLKSATANAKNNFKMDESKLYVKEIFVDEAPALKRYRARARGRAMMIKKRGSHISLTLQEKQEENSN